MNKFIFALDLDGTLAQDNALLSVQTIHQLQQWAKQGVCIVITTGRTWLNAKDIYEVCQLSTPIILYNGAYVYLPKENKVLQSFTLEKEYIHYLLLNEEFASLLAFVVCEYQNQHFEVNLTQNTTQSFVEKLTINPTSFVIQLKDKKDQEKVKKMIEKNPRYGYRYWGREWGEVYLKMISKKEGIDVVLNYFHLNSENLIFFGDGQNDVEILQYAKIGVAMKNAKIEIQQYADEITTEDNNHDGVIKHMQKWIVKKEICQ